MKIFLLSLLVGVLSTAGFVSAIEVGDTFPADTELHYGFPPEKINLGERLKGKNVIVVGLPGAFTPTWSNRQVPGYLSKEIALKSVGVDEVIIYCVNDGAVMKAWAEDQKIPEDGLITLMGDPYGTVTSALDMEMTHSGPKSVGLIDRCKRFALYVVDGVVQIKRIAEGEDDPAGDENPEVTLAESMLTAIVIYNAEKSQSNDEL